MITKLVQCDDDLALPLDDSVLESLNISADTPLEMTICGSSLLVVPIRDEKHHQNMRQSLDKINNKYGDDLRRLAE
jgi:antitoxin MazE